jgi:hypothetical protein
MALLVNPADPTIAAAQSSGVGSAAQSLGLELHVLTATSDRDFDEVFAKLSQLRPGGFVVGADWRSAIRCRRSAKAGSSSQAVA